VLPALVAVLAGAAPVAAAEGTTKQDRAIQRRATLKRSDFPTGWAAEAHERSDPPDIPSCAPLRETDATLQDLATSSPDFLKGEVARAGNSVIVLKNAKTAAAYLSVYKEPDVAACLENLAQQSFNRVDDASIRTNMSPMTNLPTGADDGVGYDIEVTITTTGGDARSVYLDAMVIQVGRALTRFTFSDRDQPLPDQAELVDAVITRLQDARV
jgi:hypothetical protein